MTKTTKSVSARASSSAESPRDDSQSENGQVQRKIKVKEKKTTNKVRKKNKQVLGVRTIKGFERNYMPCSAKIVREMQQLMNSTNYCIPKLPFCRYIKEITSKHGQYRFEGNAMEALQEAAETFIVQFMEDSYQLTRHAKRQTLNDKDMCLLKTLLTPHVESLK